ncbi:MAG: hypothetical protein ACQESR_17885, partial [Planctomycetota bacterium]
CLIHLLPVTEAVKTPAIFIPVPHEVTHCRSDTANVTCAFDRPIQLRPPDPVGGNADLQHDTGRGNYRIANKGGRIVGRYPVIFLTTAVLAGAALGWWVKRK